MKIRALLSFFDEPLKLIVSCVDGLARAGVDHVVAVDGRYALYPADYDMSPADQHAALAGACRHHGMELTLHVPSAAWEGGEVQKRTAMFQVAMALSEPFVDWWWVIDTDTIVTKSPEDLKARLEVWGQDTAEVHVVDTEAARINRPDFPAEFDLRMFFRAQPMAVVGNHYTYVRQVDGQKLWSGTTREGLPEPIDLTGVVTVEHRPNARPAERVLGKSQYYGRRDGTGIEMGQCVKCEARAVRRVVAGLRRYTDERGFKQISSHAEEMCEACSQRQEGINRRQLLQWGENPETRFNERYAIPRAHAGPGKRG